jgi:hypothetical protein
MPLRSNLEDWCSKLAAELRERNPQIAEVEQETEIKNLCLQYVQAPTRPLAASLAGKSHHLASPCSVKAARDGRRILQRTFRAKKKLNEDSSQWLNAARRLRMSS